MHIVPFMHSYVRCCQPWCSFSSLVSPDTQTNLSKKRDGPGGGGGPGPRGPRIAGLDKLHGGSGSEWKWPSCCGLEHEKGQSGSFFVLPCMFDERCTHLAPQCHFSTLLSPYFSLSLSLCPCARSCDVQDGWMRLAGARSRLLPEGRLCCWGPGGSRAAPFQLAVVGRAPVKPSEGRHKGGSTRKFLAARMLSTMPDV